MSKVMFEMIALGFQGIIIFVFDFPACSSNLDNLNNIAVRDRVIGYKAVLIQDFACTFLGDNQFQPIDLQSIIAIA